MVWGYQLTYMQQRFCTINSHTPGDGQKVQPGPWEGLEMLKKILTWGGLAFLIFFVAYRPDEAGNVVSSLAGGIMDVANGFANFFTNLVT